MKNKTTFQQLPILLLMVVMHSFALAQTVPQRPNRDTIIARELKYWDKKLQLNQAQLQNFTKEHKRNIKTTDSLQRLKYNDSTLKKEQKKVFLKAEKKEHRKQLKAILTKKQYDDYIAELKKQQALMEERMKKAGKKITKDNTEIDQ